MKIYLDIDGVILANDQQKANFADEFIKFMVDNHDVYWLTTHCKGDSSFAVELLSRYFDAETMEYFKKIKPTNWDTWKTEAIDFNSDFLWFDDQVFNEEIRILKEKDKYGSWIEIDLSKNPNQLKEFVK